MTVTAPFEQVVAPVGPQNPRNSEAAIVPLADEGETWTRFRNLEDAPDDAWAYPAITWVKEVALVTYFNYKGGLPLKLRGLPAAWFYER